MAKHRHKDADLIEALGEDGLIKQFRRAPSTVYGWKERGLPRAYDFRMALARYARSINVPLPADEFPRVEDAA